MFLFKKPIEKVIQSHKDEIFKKRGVYAIVPGTKITKGVDTKKECITIFVRTKMPENMLFESEKVPKKIGGYLTDILDLEGIPEPMSDIRQHRIRRRPVIGGTSGKCAGGSACSIGIVCFKENRPHILTNDHCTHWQRDNTGKKFLQQSPADGGRITDAIGTIIYPPIIRNDRSNKIDSAVVPLDVESELKVLGLPDYKKQWVKPRIGMNFTISSRCFTKDTLLLMNPSGVKTIEEIKIGDKVYCFDENKNSIVSNPINNIFYQGKRDVYELKTRNRTIRVTDNHPFLTAERKEVEFLQNIIGKGKNQFISWENDYWRRNKKIKWELKWKELKDIKRGDLILVLKKITNYDLSIGKELARFLGFWIGDGSAFYESRKGGRVNLYCAKKEEAERYGNLMKKLFGKNFTIHRRKNCWIVAMYSSEVAKKMLNYCSGKKLNKRIPEIIWKLPIEERIEFIEGYCDADGHRYNHLNGNKVRGYSFDTTNEVLIKQIRELCIFSGIRVTNICSYLHRGYIIARSFQFKAFPDSKIDKKCFRYEKEYAGYQNIKELKIPDGLMLQKVVSVKHAGIEDTFDIEVKNSHNFFANGILAHNTLGITKGVISHINAVAKVNFGGSLGVCEFYPCFFARQNNFNIVAGGSSGSCVFNEDGVIGQTFAASPNLAIFLTGEIIGQELGITLEKKEPVIGYLAIANWLSFNGLQITTRARVNLRSAPEIKDNIIQTLPKGSKFEIIRTGEIADNFLWVKVKCEQK